MVVKEAISLSNVDGLNTLIDYRYRQHFKAKNGSPGMGSDKTGRSGEDTIIEVPRGTLILKRIMKRSLQMLLIKINLSLF